MDDRHVERDGDSPGVRRALRDTGVSGFRVADVQEHYAELAPCYASEANVACASAYAELVRRVLAAAERVLEIGAGSSSLLPESAASLRVACDLSLPMLAAQRRPISWSRVVADAQKMPFGNATFDGICAVNVLEHVPEPGRFMAEVGRVLAAGGRFLAVTPNGDVKWLLGLLERLHLKLPEGPHRFLSFGELSVLGGQAFRVLEHRRFLALPVGPPAWVRSVDRFLAGRDGWGLFQYIVLEKLDGRSASSA
jgi:SAM-dependent methyltransferase